MQKINTHTHNNYMRRLIAASFLIFGLFAYSFAGTNVKNIQAPVYGMLESYSVGLTYSASDLQKQISREICTNLNPQIPSQESACAANLAYVKSNPELGFFSPELINTNVEGYKINYTTVGVNGEKLMVSGAILIPKVPVKSIKGVVLYFHGTEAVKSQVPSNFKGNASAYYGQDLSAIFAAQGYIVVAPDYIGLGDSTQAMHPYIEYPEPNVDSGMYMLKATRQLLQSLNVVSSSQQMSLFTTGYSEGGSYAMWSAYLFQQNKSAQFLKQNNLIFKKSAPISGAYDLVNAQLPFEFANTNLESNTYNISDPVTAYALKPVLIGYELSSFGHYTYNDKFKELAQESFFDLNKVNPVAGSYYTLYSLFASNTQPDNNALIGALTKQAAYLINPNDGTHYAPTNDSILALVQAGLEQNQKFMQRMREKSLTTWQTKVPLLIVYLKRDSLVTNLNSVNAYNGIKSKSSPSLVNKLMLDNKGLTMINPFTGKLSEIDHMQAMQILSLAALNFFNQP